MKPQELAGMPQHISDVQSGIETGNQGLVVQGVNGLLAPQLRRMSARQAPTAARSCAKRLSALTPRSMPAATIIRTA